MYSATRQRWITDVADGPSRLLKNGSVLDLLIFLSTPGIDTPRQIRRHVRMVQLREVWYGIRTGSLADRSWCRCGERWHNGGWQATFALSKCAVRVYDVSPCLQLPNRSGARSRQRSRPLRSGGSIESSSCTPKTRVTGSGLTWWRSWRRFSHLGLTLSIPGRGGIGLVSGRGLALSPSACSNIPMKAVQRTRPLWDCMLLTSQGRSEKVGVQTSCAQSRVAVAVRSAGKRFARRLHSPNRPYTEWHEVSLRTRPGMAAGST